MSKIIIGQIDLSFHRVTAALYKLLLEEWGYQTELITAPHEEMFRMQEEGRIDLLVSAWIPGSHGRYLDRYRERARPLSTIYHPYCVWCVPQYIPKQLLNKVLDLCNQEVMAKMDKEINGIGPGAGISRFSMEMMEYYHLTEHGYTFKNNSFDRFTQITEEKIALQRWFVIPIWEPQYLHSMFHLRTLNEPHKLLRGVDQATPTYLDSLIAKVAPNHLNLLRNITLGNSVVGYMDLLHCKEGISETGAAFAWIEKEYGEIAYYTEYLLKK